MSLFHSFPSGAVLPLASPPFTLEKGSFVFSSFKENSSYIREASERPAVHEPKHVNEKPKKTNGNRGVSCACRIDRRPASA